jgi:hypothetical protein
MSKGDRPEGTNNETETFDGQELIFQVNRCFCLMLRIVFVDMTPGPWFDQ